MIKHVISALFISAALAASPASAQPENVDREAVAEQIQQRVLETKERLQITEEQAPVVQEILRESAERRFAILEKYGFGDGERPSLSFREKRKLRGEINNVNQDTLGRLSEVLTDDQLQEYKKIQEERRAEMRERLQSR